MSNNVSRLANFSYLSRIKDKSSDIPILNQIYKGSYKDGKKHGYGELSFHHEKLGKKVLVKGTWKNGHLQGKGTVILMGNGNIIDVFDGMFKKNSALGQGLLKFSNGDQYHGFFRKGAKEGPVKFDFNLL